jgi:hypothetical protein
MHTIERSRRYDRDLANSLNGRIAHPEDRALVTGVLTRAFQDDPVMQWTLRKGPRHEAARRALIDSTVGGIAIGLGHTYILEDGSASAAWSSNRRTCISIVFEAAKLKISTSFFCPMRCTRPMRCSMTIGFQGSS